MKRARVLGVGGAKCVQTAEHAKAAAQALSLEIELVKVDTLAETAKFGRALHPGACRRRHGEGRRASADCGRDQGLAVGLAEGQRG